MLTIFFMTSLASIISFMMMAIALATSKKSKKEREKATPFECGFSPFKKARSPFSLRFFMIAMIFLIFDIELALLLPMGVLTTSKSKLMVSTLGLTVTLILTAGLLHEWKQGALNWIK